MVSGAIASYAHLTENKRLTTVNDESLLGPILSALVRLDRPVDIRELLQFMYMQGAFPHTPKNVWLSINGESGKLLRLAVTKLDQAGLVKSDSPHVYEVTADGALMLRERGDELSLKDLKKLPRYLEHLEHEVASFRRLQWQVLRFDYYVSGRMLALQGSFHAAPTLLAYAIEYSFKAALTEKGIKDLGHKLQQLYERCCSEGFFTDTAISDEFLEYAQDHFARRYPSGQEELLGRRSGWTFGGGDIIAAYDDCIIQLDGSLDRCFGSGKWSLGNNAVRTKFTWKVEAFFRDNIFAIDKFDEYRATIDDDRHLNDLVRAHEEHPQNLFSGSNTAYARAVKSAKPAANFVYPTIERQQD